MIRPRTSQTLLSVSAALLLQSAATTAGGPALAAASDTVAAAPETASRAAEPPGDPRVAVAVLPLGLSARTAERYPGLLARHVGFGVHNLLVDRLYASRRFRLVEDKQEVVDDLLDRQWIASSGAVSQESAVRYGKLLGARYVLYGEVYDFSSQRLKKKVLETRISLQIRLVDVETSEYVPASGTGAETRKGKVFVQEDRQEFARGTVGTATAAALDEAVATLLRRSAGRW